MITIPDYSMDIKSYLKEHIKYLKKRIKWLNKDVLGELEETQNLEQELMRCRDIEK